MFGMIDTFRSEQPPKSCAPGRCSAVLRWAGVQGDCRAAAWHCIAQIRGERNCSVDQCAADGDVMIEPACSDCARDVTERAPKLSGFQSMMVIVASRSHDCKGGSPDTRTVACGHRAIFRFALHCIARWQLRLAAGGNGWRQAPHCQTSGWRVLTITA